MYLLQILMKKETNSMTAKLMSLWMTWMFLLRNRNQIETKNSDASDYFSSSFHDVATLLAENMRAIGEQISRSIASDMVVQQKLEEFQIIHEKATNLYPTLCEIEGLTVAERYRALSKIPDHPTQMLVFFSLPSDVQLEWVRRFLADH
ncbi:hypothetical protein V6Z11_D03G052100 [Gossypium hirsutum]